MLQNKSRSITFTVPESISSPTTLPIIHATSSTFVPYTPTFIPKHLPLKHHLPIRSKSVCTRHQRASMSYRAKLKQQENQLHCISSERLTNQITHFSPRFLPKTTSTKQEWGRSFSFKVPIYSVYSFK